MMQMGDDGEFYDLPPRKPKRGEPSWWMKQLVEIVKLIIAIGGITVVVTVVINNNNQFPTPTPITLSPEETRLPTATEPPTSTRSLPALETRVPPPLPFPTETYFPTLLPTSTQTPIPTFLPSATQRSIPTILPSLAAPIQVAMITVQGNDSDGELFICPSDGTYQFTLIDGAYNGWPSRDTGWWRTRIYIFKNTEIMYQDQEDPNDLGRGEPRSDLYLGEFEPSHAEWVTEAYMTERPDTSITIECVTGDQLRFVPVDRVILANPNNHAYNDNIGQVTITVTI